MCAEHINHLCANGSEAVDVSETSYTLEALIRLTNMFSSLSTISIYMVYLYCAHVHLHSNTDAVRLRKQ